MLREIILLARVRGLGQCASCDKRGQHVMAHHGQEIVLLCEICATLVPTSLLIPLERSPLNMVLLGNHSRN